MTTYSILDNQIDNLILDGNTNSFIKSQPDIFKQQFLFYRKDVGHSIDKSINRAMTETFEIYENIIYQSYHALNDDNLTDREKIKTAKSFLNNFH